MSEIKFTFHICLVASSLEMQRRFIKTKGLQVFFSFSKETTNEPSEVAAAKIFSSNVHVLDTTCFDECFLFHLITGSNWSL